MFYKIGIHSNSKNTIIMPVDFLKNNYNLIDKTEITIYFGGRKSTVNFVYDKEQGENIIQLSEDAAKDLCIPCNMNYQIRVVKDGIRIGPVIGLLLAKYKKSLNEKSLDSFLKYALLYPKFQGLLYMFSEEGINPNSNTIDGVYLKPDIKNKKMLFKEDILPYPSVIYRRIGLSKAKRDFLMNITNNNMFNSCYFNKWEFWQFASAHGEIKDNIPYTCLLKSLDTIDTMLNKYKVVYLKLINGSLAQGLIKVWKNEEKYCFKSKHDKNPKRFGKEEAKEFLKKLKGNYLVQQGIECLNYDSRYTDFRVIMQKDHTRLWNCTGIISRLGRKGGISSNYEAAGYALSFEENMSRILNCDKEFVFKKRQEVIHLCKRICELLDSTEENYGDLGIDVAIDENLKVWIFEINKRHFHTMPLAINDTQMYYEVKNNPIKYALALSGFLNY